MYHIDDCYLCGKPVDGEDIHGIAAFVNSEKGQPRELLWSHRRCEAKEHGHSVDDMGGYLSSKELVEAVDNHMEATFERNTSQDVDGWAANH